MTFDTTPKPAFLRFLKAQNWRPAGAISELVDNSFGPLRGDAQRCEVTFDTHRRVLTVLDNGKGMDGVGRVFQLGNAIGRGPGDIGLYGSGGTMALIWLADQATVWTLRDGRINTDRVDWVDQIERDAFPQVSTEWAKANTSNTPPELLAVRHGTLIELHLSRQRTFQVSNVQRDLAETYAPALRKHKTLTWTTVGKNGQTQELRAPMQEFDPETSVTIEGFLDLPSGELLGVRGIVGLVPALPLTQSRVAFGFGSRVIFRTRDCYRSPSSEERFNEAGVAGYIDLLEGWQPFLTGTKDEIDDGPVRQKLMEWIFDKVRPILQQRQRNDMQLLLSDIALALTAALSGPRVQTEIAEKVYGPGPGPTPGEGHSKITITPKGDGMAKVKGTLPSGSAFDIISLDDASMGRRLCMAEPDGDSIAIYVNEDHEWVKTAMEQRPVNRMMLEILITREIADLLEKDEELRRRAFRSRRDLEEIESAPHKGATIHRLLVDRIQHAKDEATA